MLKECKTSTPRTAVAVYSVLDFYDLETMIWSSLFPSVHHSRHVQTRGLTPHTPINRHRH